MWPRSRSDRARGFSLTELLVTMAALIVILTLSATGAQVTGVQMVSLTHKGMVDADGYRDVRPRMRYDIELYPLWTVRLTKRTF